MPRTRPQKVATLDVAEEVARRVPGYRGYQDLAQRLEDDRRFRTSIAECLNGEAHRLERIEARMFGDDYSDILEEIDSGARKLEYLAETLALATPQKKGYVSDRGADQTADVDRRIVAELDRLHRVVQELEKAYTNDQRFEMNLAELRSSSERIAEYIEERSIALAK